MGIEREKGFKRQEAKELVRACWNWGLGETDGRFKWEGFTQAELGR